MTTTPSPQRGGGISQKHSGIPEEPREKHDHGNHWHLRLLNTTDNSLAAYAVRLGAFALLYLVLGFYITFSGEGNGVNNMWSVGLGAIAAYALIFTLLALESFVVHPWWYRKDVGRPMVHWFTWSIFLDFVYQFLHPKYKIDLRETEYAGRIGEPHEEGFDSATVSKRVKDDDDPQQKVVVGEEQNDVEKQAKRDAAGDEAKRYTYMDFTADVGDGFSPTYAVFSSMARETLSTREGVVLPRADFVIVGGDVAYAWPTWDNLMSRFVRPVSWAFPRQSVANGRGSHPNMYVLPGNHEWFKFENFRDYILKRDEMGGWNQKAKTPYFAIHLAKERWWIFCFDMGSEAAQDLDEAQFEYFRNIVETKTGNDDRFIAVHHEPDFVKNGSRGHGFALFKRYAELRRNVLGPRLLLSLTGDLHYYRRLEEITESETELSEVAAESLFSERLTVEGKLFFHELWGGTDDGRSTEKTTKPIRTSKRQLVVAGNGGAFAHPTSIPRVRVVKLGEPHFSDGNRYVVRANHPTESQSDMTYLKRFLFGFSFGKNYGFGSILGLMYMGMTLAVSLYDYQGAGGQFPTGFQVLENASYMKRMVSSLWFYPPFLWLAVQNIIVAATSQAMNVRRNLYVVLCISTIHTLAHLGMVFATRKLSDAAWAEALYSASGARTVDFGFDVLFCFLSNSSMFFFGYFLGTYVTTFYLFFAAFGLRTYYNEPMSTIEMQDWKGFLRLRFDTLTGSVELFSISVMRTPREWRERREGEAPKDGFVGHFIPTDVKLEYEIVDRFILERGKETYSPGDITLA